MSTLKRDLSIALLLGGPGAEREVSLVSGNSVYDALARAGFTNVTRVDVQGPDFRLPEGTELAYNIIHGTFGEDGALQSILENAASRTPEQAPVPAPSVLTRPNPKNLHGSRSPHPKGRNPELFQRHHDAVPSAAFRHQAAL